MAILYPARFEMRTGVRRANDTRCIYDFYSDYDDDGDGSAVVKTGRFFSPQYPQHYPPRATCQYFFHARQREKVQLTFDVVELEITTGRYRRSKRFQSINQDFNSSWQTASRQSKMNTYAKRN